MASHSDKCRNCELQAWQVTAEASGGPQNPSNQFLAAAAMFLVELTTADPHWAEWKETDITSVRYTLLRTVVAHIMVQK